jgi:hypothetical protein
MGILLAVALIAHATTALRASLFAFPVPAVTLAMYFTFSRGAWLALAAGLAFSLAIDPRRLRLTLVACCLGLPLSLCLFAASRFSALTREGGSGNLVREGQELAVLVLITMLVTAAAAAGATWTARRMTTPSWAARAYVLTLGVAAVAFASAGVVYLGGPRAAAERAWHAFEEPAPRSSDLSSRLYMFSGNHRAELYRVAWNDWMAHPILGSGAGSFEATWLRARTAPTKVRDAHSLYLETLAELGLVGLTVLAAGLAMPVVVALRARGKPMVAASVSAYVAYLVGAGIDWDWELAAVTVPGVLVGAVVLGLGRAANRRVSGALRPLLIVLPVVIFVLGLTSLLGNIWLARADAAAELGHWQGAARESRRAVPFLFWSPAPWQELGEAQLAGGSPALAQRSFEKAISKRPSDWSLWFDLARASTGRAQAAALTHAAKLNPLSPEIAEFYAELEDSPTIHISAGGNG